MTKKILKGESLIKKKRSLQKVGTDENGWNIYYIADNFEKWVEECPNSEFQSGGMPQLRLIQEFPLGIGLKFPQ